MANRNFGAQQSRYQSENYGYEDQLYKVGTGGTIYEDTQGRSEREMRQQANGPHAGRGPQNYSRSDDRISEEINELLTDHPRLDATDIEVELEQGYVRLKGTISSRAQKYLAEDLALSVKGVRDVENRLRIDSQ